MGTDNRIFCLHWGKKMTKNQYGLKSGDISIRAIGTVQFIAGGKMAPGFGFFLPAGHIIEGTGLHATGFRNPAPMQQDQGKLDGFLYID
jgi:hypothetical protein